MDNTITIEQIQDTKSYKALNSVQQSFCTKRTNRQLLTNALIVNQSTGIIPSNVKGYNVGLLNDLIGKSTKSE